MIGATITRPLRQWHNMVERVPHATDEQVRVECIAGVVTFRLEDGTLLEVDYDDLRRELFEAKHGPDATACACGCWEPTKPYTASNKKQGFVKGKAAKYLRNHHLRRHEAPLCGYVIDPDTGCWIWLLTKSGGGYGSATKNGRTRPVHIDMWEEHNGRSVPEGLHLDHLCRNRGCVNPEHLELVTPAENAQRGDLAKLTAREVLVIRASDQPDAVLARRYGVTKSNINHIRRGVSWKNLFFAAHGDAA